MKIKNDFVTNSSSCSFIVWGITIEPEEIKKRCGEKLFSILYKQRDEAKQKRALKQGAFMAIATTKTDEEIETKYKEYLESDEVITDEELEDLLPGVKIRKKPYESEIMIGISPFSHPKDQTLDEFKRDICEKINVIGMGLDPKDLYSIEECWEDR